MLSGYPSRIYEKLERCEWRKVCWNVACHAVGKTRQTEILGEEVTEEKGQRRMECVWMNYSVKGEQLKLL